MQHVDKYPSGVIFAYAIERIKGEHFINRAGCYVYKRRKTQNSNCLLMTFIHW